MNPRDSDHSDLKCQNDDYVCTNAYYQSGRGRQLKHKSRSVAPSVTILGLGRNG